MKAIIAATMVDAIIVDQVGELILSTSPLVVRRIAAQFSYLGTERLITGHVETPPKHIRYVRPSIRMEH